MHHRGAARRRPSRSRHAAGRRPSDGPEPARNRSCARNSATTRLACSSTGTRCRSPRLRSARSIESCCETAGWRRSRSSIRASARPSADLDNAMLLYSMASAFALKGLDLKGLVDELRARMIEELDYRLGAANIRQFAEHCDHPWVRLPMLVLELSARRVLTTEWIDGWTWAEFVERADDDAKQRAGEIIWRFAQGSVHRLGAFNGDPHPGNYRFHTDGSVTFLDFGLVKRWEEDEWERLSPCLGAILAQDQDELVAAMGASGFLPAGHTADPAATLSYVSAPYRPYLVDRFRFTREFVRDTVSRILDVKGPSGDAVQQFDLPPSFVVLDRVVWGVSALLGKLDAEGPWRACCSPTGTEPRAEALSAIRSVRGWTASVPSGRRDRRRHLRTHQPGRPTHCDRRTGRRRTRSAGRSPGLVVPDAVRADRDLGERIGRFTGTAAVGGHCHQFAWHADL
ncbi:MAG: AarF/UbiB family protein [Ilumatobacteraceae bacterium]